MWERQTRRERQRPEDRQRAIEKGWQTDCSTDRKTSREIKIFQVICIIAVYIRLNTTRSFFNESMLFEALNNNKTIHDICLVKFMTCAPSAFNIVIIFALLL